MYSFSRNFSTDIIFQLAPPCSAHFSPLQNLEIKIELELQLQLELDRYLSAVTSLDKSIRMMFNEDIVAVTGLSQVGLG